MGKRDVLNQGTYTPLEASHYLKVPYSTLRTWIFGQSIGGEKARKMKPVVKVADPYDRLLSFHNLVEIHVLAAIRREHNIPLPKIRGALRFVEKKLETDRPLLNQSFLTDGLDLFIEKSGILLNVSQEGQTTLKNILENFLSRIERNPKGIPIKLYPFSRHAGESDDRKIVIDPTVSFGKPVIAGTAVSTSSIFERFLAGEPMAELAEDFGVEPSLIEEAIRCEQVKETAS